MSTLLEKARAVKMKQRIKKRIWPPYNTELLEVVVAWLNREVSTNQIYYVLFGKDSRVVSGNVLYGISTTLRDAIEKGDIEVKVKALKNNI